MSEEKEPQPLTHRFVELWGEQAAHVELLGQVIRVAEGAMFQDDLKAELERIRELVVGGIETIDQQPEKPEAGFGFSREHDA